MVSDGQKWYAPGLSWIPHGAVRQVECPSARLFLQAGYVGTCVKVSLDLLSFLTQGSSLEMAGLVNVSSQLGIGSLGRTVEMVLWILACGQGCHGYWSHGGTIPYRK